MRIMQMMQTHCGIETESKLFWIHFQLQWWQITASFTGSYCRCWMRVYSNFSEMSLACEWIENMQVISRIRIHLFGMNGIANCFVANNNKIANSACQRQTMRLNAPNRTFPQFHDPPNLLPPHTDSLRHIFVYEKHFILWLCFRLSLVSRFTLNYRIVSFATAWRAFHCWNVKIFLFWTHFSFRMSGAQFKLVFRVPV